MNPTPPLKHLSQAVESGGTEVALEPFVLGLRRAFRQPGGGALEKWLAMSPLAARPQLVLPLVAEEVALRQQVGQAPNLGEYLARFPQYREQIREGWDQLAAQRLRDRPTILGYPPIESVGTMRCCFATG